jgi:hypothetical protein
VEGVGIFAAVVVAITNSCQWRDANRNFRLDQRAWVHTYIDSKAPELRVPVAVGVPIVIPVVLTNSGKTPAFGVHGSVIVSLLRAGDVPEFIYSPGHPRMNIGVESMYPGTNSDPIPATILESGRSEPSQVLISESQREGIALGTLDLFVHGTIEYRDIFNTRHWVTFCYQPSLGGNGTRSDGKVATIRIEPSRSQACIDDNKADNN